MSDKQQMLPLNLNEDEAEMILRWASQVVHSSVMYKHDNDLLLKIFGAFPNLKREWEFMLS